MISETVWLIIVFLSTLSLRRATTAMVGLLMCNLYFYPRSPCGERHDPIVHIEKCYLFLSTLSLRRATEKVPAEVFYTAFLSTLSLRRAT